MALILQECSNLAKSVVSSVFRRSREKRWPSGYGSPPTHGEVRRQVAQLLKKPLTNYSSDFVSISRRSELSANSAGTHALFSESVYQSQNNETVTSLYVVNLAASQSKLLSQDSNIANPRWTGRETQVAWSKPTGPNTEIWIGDTEDGLKRYDLKPFNGTAN